MSNSDDNSIAFIESSKVEDENSKVQNTKTVAPNNENASIFSTELMNTHSIVAESNALCTVFSKDHDPTNAMPANESVQRGSLRFGSNNCNKYNAQSNFVHKNKNNASTFAPNNNCNGGLNWQLFSVTLHRAHSSGFGIAISGGRDNLHLATGNSAIFVSDVIATGPAFGLLQVNDHIVSANGFSLEYADYAFAIAIMKDAEQLNMIVKRRVPLPFVEFEQRTLKFTLSKSHKKDDFGIVLGCRYYIKEITNPKLAEKDPGLKEGDNILRINGQSLEQLSMEEAARLLHRSREKLSLVVQRDVRRCSGGLRWPSQTTVYERLGSVSSTPRQSPTPVHYTHSATLNGAQTGFGSTSVLLGHHNLRKLSDFAKEPKKFSDMVLPTTTSLSPQLGYSSPLLQHKMDFSQVQKNFSDDQQHYPLMNAFSQQHLNSNNVIPQQALQISHMSENCNHAHHNYTSSNNQLSIRKSQSPQALSNLQNPNQSQTKLGNYQSNSTQFLPTLQKSQTPNSPVMSSLSISGLQQKKNIIGAAASSPLQQKQQPQSQQMTLGVYNSTINNSGNYANHSTSLQQQQQPSYQSAQFICQSQNFSNGNCFGGVSNGTRNNDLRVVNFCKGNGSLGIRVIGGNQVGIFVSAVQENSPAAQNGIRVGDRLYQVNGFSMNGVTREQAVEYLMGLGDEINVYVEHSANEDFSHIKGGQMGDSFFVRTHFSYQKRLTRQELSFNAGDIFHVTDTLAGGSVGFWQVGKVYSANETEIKSNETSGIIPNSKTAEILAKQSQVDSSTLGRSIFRKKLQTHRTKSLTTSNAEDDFLNKNPDRSATCFDIPLPAYERVALKKPAFYRPVVLFGPLCDVARNLLLLNYGTQFGAVFSNFAPNNNAKNNIMRMSSIDAVMAAQKHCVLNISPGSVERLQLAQYAPIVILVDVDSKNRIRELRSKAGSTTGSARKLMEQASKIKKHHSYLLTATLDASKEDDWFEALRHLIFHLQDRRVWMPEFLPTQPVEDLLLFPIQNCNLDPSDGEAPLSASLKPIFDNSMDFIYDDAKSGASSISTLAQTLNDGRNIVQIDDPNDKTFLTANSNVSIKSNSLPSELKNNMTVNGNNSNGKFFHNNAKNFSYLRSVATSLTANDSCIDNSTITRLSQTKSPVIYPNCERSMSASAVAPFATGETI